MNTLWAAACGGWVLGMLQGAFIAYIVLTYHRRKGGAIMLRDKIRKASRWVSDHWLGMAVVLIFVTNGLGWAVQLQQNATNDRQDRVATTQDRRIAQVAVCTGKYLAADAAARDARSDAVKPRDEAEARFIAAVAALRNSDGSDPEGDKVKVDALFDATDDFEKAKAELDKVRAVDYPTYTCDKDR